MVSPGGRTCTQCTQYAHNKRTHTCTPHWMHFKARGQARQSGRRREAAVPAHRRQRLDKAALVLAGATHRCLDARSWRLGDGVARAGEPQEWCWRGATRRPLPRRSWLSEPAIPAAARVPACQAGASTLPRLHAGTGFSLAAAAIILSAVELRAVDRSLPVGGDRRAVAGKSRLVRVPARLRHSAPSTRGGCLRLLLRGDRTSAQLRLRG